MADAYSQQLVALQEREAELHAAIASASEAEQVALRDHVMKRPTVRPFGDLTSDAWKARRRREKLEKELVSLQAELPLMKQAALDATREAAVADLAKYAAKIRSVESRQPEIWEQLTAIFRELLVTYTTENASVRDERRQVDIEAREALSSFGDLRAQWETEIFPSEQTRPLPSTLRSCLDLLEKDAFNDPDMTDVMRGISPFVPTGMGASLTSSEA